MRKPEEQSSRPTNREQAKGNGLFLLFQSPGYSWLWSSTLLSGLGQTLEMLTVGWLVLEMTDSPLWVGLVTALRGVGLFFLAPIAGVIADRVDRKKLLVLAQVMNTTNTLTMGVLIVTDVIELWLIMPLVALQGVAWAIRMPVRNTLAFDLVGRQLALGAVSANFMAMHITRIAGPVTAGLIISAYGPGEAYLVATVGHFLAIAALLMVPRPTNISPARGSTLSNLREGYSHVRGNRPVRSIFSLVAITEPFGFSYQAMLPVIARDVLEVGPTELGILASSFGAGAVIASLAVSSLGDFKFKGWLLVGASFLFGIFLLLFAFSETYVLSAILLALAGASAVTYDSSVGALLQTLVPDDMRGRVMGVYGSFMGMAPLGGVQAGAIAALVTAPFAVGFGGSLVALNSLRLARLAPKIRQLETQTGEEESSAEGLEPKGAMDS